MRKVDAEMIRKARNGNQEVLFDIYSKYVEIIGKFAQKIYKMYHVCSIQELVNRGYDGLADAIMNCNIDNDSETYFSVIVDNCIIRSMFGMPWYEVRKAVNKVERIYGRKYICTDDDMTESIITMLKPPYGSLIKNTSTGGKEDVIEENIRKKLKEYYSVSYNDMKNVRLPADASIGSKDRNEYLNARLNYAFQLVSPKQEAYIRLRYGFFDKRVYSDDEISKMLMIPIDKIESIQRKKINNEYINECENAILDLKSGLVSGEEISYLDIGRVYNRTYQSIESSVKRGIEIIKAGLMCENIDLASIKNIRRK